MKAMRIVFPLVVLGAVVTGCASGSKKPVQEPEAKLQLSELDGMTRLNFPEHFETVGEAARWLLKPTGYQLRANCPGCSKEAARILEDPISPLAFVDRMTSIKRALALVAGTDCRLVVDEKNRLVSYDFMTE